MKDAHEAARTPFLRARPGLLMDREPWAERAGEPLPRELETLEARVRVKLEMGVPLTREERALFARLRADKETPPGRVRRRP